MGMDAFYNGVDFRFSGLMAQIAMDNFPSIRRTANNEGFVDLTKGEVGELINELSVALMRVAVKASNQVSQGAFPLARVKTIHSSSFKLYMLMQWWYDPETDGKTLLFT